MIKKISFSIFILGCFTSILTGDSEWYSIGLVGAVNFFIFACLFKLVKRTYRAIIGEETTKIISQSKEKQLQEDWDQAIKEINETKGFRGFILGFAYGLAISIFSFISVPLSLVDKSWKYHPRYHDKLFGILFIFFSLGLSIGIRVGVREIANDLGNISDASSDVNTNSTTNTLNQPTGNELVTRNSTTINDADNSILLIHQSLSNNSIESSITNETQSTNANQHSSDIVVTNENGIPIIRFNAQSGILYNGDGHEIAHLINNYLISADGESLARYDPTSNLFYDKYSQPLNVKIDGTTFQHVKDVHGNGIEVINGEVFDAKTHQRIASISTIPKA